MLGLEWTRRTLGHSHTGLEGGWWYLRGCRFLWNEREMAWSREGRGAPSAWSRGEKRPKEAVEELVASAPSLSTPRASQAAPLLPTLQAGSGPTSSSCQLCWAPSEEAVAVGQDEGGSGVTDLATLGGETWGLRDCEQVDSAVSSLCGFG